MEINLISTTKIVKLNNVPCRIWEGTTASGIKIHAYIAKVAVNQDEPDFSEFERELESSPAPSPAIDAIPAKLIC